MKLGIYSTYSPRSSIHRLARCSNFLCHKKFRILSVQLGPRGSNDRRVGHKMATFHMFFQSREQVVVGRCQIRRTGRVIKRVEAQVGQFLPSCKCPVSRGIVVRDFFSGPIGGHGRNLVISLWPGDKATVNGVRYSGSLHPKIFRFQKSSGIILAAIFWDQDGILLIDYLPKGQNINAEYYSSLMVQLKDILKEKRCVKFTRASCSCTTMPRLTWHLQPRRNWPTWLSNPLITHHLLRIWPRWTTTCSLDWKNKGKLTIFRPTRRSLLPRRPGWTDDIKCITNVKTQVGTKWRVDW